MRGLTVSGGIADGFLAYLQAWAAANGALRGLPQFTVSIAGTDPLAMSVCNTSTGRVTGAPPTTVLATVPPGCAVFGDFVLGRDGRLDSFTINGASLAGRLGGVPASPFAAGSTAAGAGFQRVSDDALVVVVTIDGDTSAWSLDWESAHYLHGGGGATPVSTESSAWMTGLAGPVSGYAILVFPGVAPGGVVQIQGTVADPAAGPAATLFELPVLTIA
jgi:hypothetical protein